MIERKIVLVKATGCKECIYHDTNNSCNKPVGSEGCSTPSSQFRYADELPSEAKAAIDTLNSLLGEPPKKVYDREELLRTAVALFKGFPHEAYNNAKELIDLVDDDVNVINMEGESVL